VDERRLSQMLDDLAGGRLSVPDAVDGLRSLPFEEIPGAKVDHHRELRTGQAEAIYGPGKTPAQVRDIAAALVARASGAVLLTRADRGQADAARSVVPEASFDEGSGLVVLRRAERRDRSVAVVAAGTSDLPVAEEAAGTADALGLTVTRVEDVGVAGVHRVLAHREEIEHSACVIVIAGMEGALPSVVAGLTSRPVVAVPTSVGYGASFEGLAALLGMLSSCAAGVAVVNIDNGFGAALVADRIVRGGDG
jgi:pyridinium-3,5-biscarboxylic acid mononucleotide synthase